MYEVPPCAPNMEEGLCRLANLQMRMAAFRCNDPPPRPPPRPPASQVRTDLLVSEPEFEPTSIGSHV